MILPVFTILIILLCASFFFVNLAHSIRMAFTITYPIATIIYFLIFASYSILSFLRVVPLYSVLIEPVTGTVRQVWFLLLLYIYIILATGIVTVYFVRDEPIGRAIMRANLRIYCLITEMPNVWSYILWAGFVLTSAVLTFIIYSWQIPADTSYLLDAGYAIVGLCIIYGIFMLFMPKPIRRYVVSGDNRSLTVIAQIIGSSSAQELFDFNAGRDYRNSNLPIDFDIDLPIGTILYIPPPPFTNALPPSSDNTNETTE
jgi:hypothetical protein